MTTISPTAARICEDCTNLVTTDETCPLCDVPTKPHPEAEEAYGYCQGCAKGPFHLGTMHLVTWNEDPYVQTEDGDLYYLCPKCHAEKEEDAE
jgi:Zn finger protein HypA/HybF involved in hydrogenase expression